MNARRGEDEAITCANTAFALSMSGEGLFVSGSRGDEPNRETVQEVFGLGDQ
jgi:hypothetical protein